MVQKKHVLTDGNIVWKMHLAYDTEVTSRSWENHCHLIWKQHQSSKNTSKMKSRKIGIIKNKSSNVMKQTFSIILGPGQHSYANYTSGFNAWCYAPIIWSSQMRKDNNAHALKNKRAKIWCLYSGNTIRMLESYSLCYPTDSATAFEKYFEKKGEIIQGPYRQYWICYFCHDVCCTMQTRIAV